MGRQQFIMTWFYFEFSVNTVHGFHRITGNPVSCLVFISGLSCHVWGAVSAGSSPACSQVQSETPQDAEDTTWLCPPHTHTPSCFCFSHSLMGLFSQKLLRGSGCLPGCGGIFRGAVGGLVVLLQEQMLEFFFLHVDLL